ncbi:uncharacterized protein NMK_1240 [Novimethylophilus kurashikiensis]|uniref:Uncharacterized protein n=1 Tax=Novimethylophilus kurashikiensis TaxID=1825523 RepID=A0A2R5F785_9PROT|nr:hypothetical protein [Novimethylophilus kurashikiensis]GBG13689.1 uncharacterized protein NMK_1240 [Novimethylophilus kurashikiensis]
MKKWAIFLINIYSAVALADPSPLGRLFFTPAERRQLEQSSPPQPPSTPAPLPKLEINGIVQRSDGKGTVWLNRQPIQEDTHQENVQIGKLRQNSDRVRLDLPQHRLSLRPGQHLDTVTGKAVDNIVVQQTGTTH